MDDNVFFKFTYLSQNRMVSDLILFIKRDICNLNFWDLTSFRSNVPQLIFIFLIINLLV